MKAKQDAKGLTSKLLSCLIVGLIIAGTAFLPVVADVDKGSGIMTMLFLGFLGAIIAVQIVPGLMLFGLMVKGIASLVRREPARESKKID